MFGGGWRGVSKRKVQIYIKNIKKTEKITLSGGGVVSRFRGGGSLPPRLGRCKNITACNTKSIITLYWKTLIYVFILCVIVTAITFNKASHLCDRHGRGFGAIAACTVTTKAVDKHQGFISHFQLQPTTLSITGFLSHRNTLQGSRLRTASEIKLISFRREFL